MGSPRSERTPGAGAQGLHSPLGPSQMLARSTEQLAAAGEGGGRAKQLLPLGPHSVPGLGQGAPGTWPGSALPSRAQLIPDSPVPGEPPRPARSKHTCLCGAPGSPSRSPSPARLDPSVWDGKQHSALLPAPRPHPGPGRCLAVQGANVPSHGAGHRLPPAPALHWGSWIWPLNLSLGPTSHPAFLPHGKSQGLLATCLPGRRVLARARAADLQAGTLSPKEGRAGYPSSPRLVPLVPQGLGLRGLLDALRNRLS